MKKITFNGTISNELVEVIEENNISIVCIDSDEYEISDEDFAKLQDVAPVAFDGNDIIVL